MVIFKLLFLSYVLTNLYIYIYIFFFFYLTASTDMLYKVHKFKKKLESTNIDLTHS